MKNIDISQGVESISNFAFLNLQSLLSINIPEGVIHIGDYCFSECTNLESVVLPSSLETIGGGAFSNCNSLVSINLPNNLQWIGSYAFSNCISLESISIPKSVKAIHASAFSGCSNLYSLMIINEPRFDGFDQFSGCTRLTEITLGYPVRDFESYYGYFFKDTPYYKNNKPITSGIGFLELRIAPKAITKSKIGDFSLALDGHSLGNFLHEEVTQNIDVGAHNLTYYYSTRIGSPKSRRIDFRIEENKKTIIEIRSSFNGYSDFIKYCE